jgi:hypothetical protein
VIKTSGTQIQPGGYYPCGSPRFSTTDLQFYVSHPNMAWVPASSSNLSSLTGVINIATSIGAMQIARIKLNAFTNGTFYQVGKVYSGLIWYTHNGVSETTSSEYEVLACLPQPVTTTTSTTTQIPTTTTTTPIPTTTTVAPCGNYIFYYLNLFDF